MKINELILIPGAGYFGEPSYSQGPVNGNLAAVDLIDRYFETILEELDNSSIRHRVVNTRKAPGTKPEHLFKDVLDNCFAVQCKMGWIPPSKKVKTIANMSIVRANRNAPSKLVAELIDVLRHHGRLITHEHRAGEAEQDEPGITIEPFYINGPSAEDYARRLPSLGRDIGRFLADFCAKRGDGAKIAPNRAMQRGIV